MCLSYAGRLSLIKYVVIGSLNYYFQIYKWPSSLLSLLVRSIRNFLWTGNLETRKSIVVAWKKVCRPCVDGGLGLRDLTLQNEALLKKLAWNVLTKESQVFRFLRARFFKDHYVSKMYKFSSSIWGRFKGHVLQLGVDMDGWKAFQSEVLD